jgi:hypothetical protein
MGFCAATEEGWEDWFWHPASLEVLKGALAFMRALGEALLDADDLFSHFGVDDFLGFWRILAETDPCTQIKFIKYWTVWPMAQWLRQPLPKLPAGYPESLATLSFPLPFSGRARQHFRNLLASRTSSRRSAKVMVAMLQGVKRGCAPAPSSFIVEAMIQHWDALTRDVELQDDDARRYAKAFKDLWFDHGAPGGSYRVSTEDLPPPREEELAEEAEEATWRWTRTGLKKPRDWQRRLKCPGTHACWESQRSMGGKAGFLHLANLDTDGSFDYTSLPTDYADAADVIRVQVAEARLQTILSTPDVGERIKSFLGDSAAALPPMAETSHTRAHVRHGLFPSRCVRVSNVTVAAGRATARELGVDIPRGPWKFAEAVGSDRPIYALDDDIERFPRLGPPLVPGARNGPRATKYISEWITEEISARISPPPLLGMVETSPGVVESVYALPAARYSAVLRAAHRWLLREAAAQETWYANTVERDSFYHLQQRLRELARANRGLPEGSFEELRRQMVEEMLARETGRAHCYAEVAPVLEPLKCRLISKGPALPYWAASAWQRHLWDRLQRFPCFALTGQPVDGSHIEGLLARERALGLDFPKWVSGDYAAATDGLSSRINSLCLEAALDAFGATGAERAVMRSVLGPHILVYPRRYVEQAEEMGLGGGCLNGGLQRNGQLMGSPLSFPVLCAINAACYREALMRYLGRPVAWEDLPVLVNGDDILFRANDELYGYWLEEITKAGFSLSQGKNYFSESLLTVNSRFWLWRPERGTGYLEEVGFLNVGLLLSEAAVKPALRPENRDMCWIDKANACLEGCENPERTQRRLRHYYRDAIARDTGSGEANLHIAPELGGLGLSTRGAEQYSTSFQRKLAWWLRAKFNALVGHLEASQVRPYLRVGPRLETPGAVTLPRHDRVWPVVVREIGEPRHEHELRQEDLEADIALMGEQRPLDTEHGAWSFTWMTSAMLREFRRLLPSNPGYAGSGLWEFRLEHRFLQTPLPIEPFSS